MRKGYGVMMQACRVFQDAYIYNLLSNVQRKILGYFKRHKLMTEG